MLFFDFITSQTAQRAEKANVYPFKQQKMINVVATEKYCKTSQGKAVTFVYTLYLITH